MKYAKLYSAFVKMDIKRITMYRFDFLIGNIGYLFESIAMLFTLGLTVSFSGTLGDFTAKEMFFFYAFVLLVSTTWEFFFVSILEIPYLIKTGELDIFLLRPMNVLFQFLIFELDEESLFEWMIAVALLIYTGMTIPIHVSFIWVLKFLCLFLSALLTQTALYLAISSLAFWTIDNDGVKRIVWELNVLARYPLSIYPIGVQVFLWIPFGIMGYFPVKSLLRIEGFSIQDVLMVIAGPLLLGVVYHTFWKKGLKRYESTGS